MKIKDKIIIYFILLQIILKNIYNYYLIKLFSTILFMWLFDYIIVSRFKLINYMFVYILFIKEY